MDYDLIIIGAGSGGATAAATAVELGVEKVLLVEKDRIGGACTNTGCVPTKAELYAAKLMRDAARAHEFGFDEREPVPNFQAIYAYKSRVVSEIRAAGERALKRLDIEFKKGTAVLTGPQSVAIDGTTVTGKFILLAVGSEPEVPPIDGLDRIPFLTSTTALEVQSLPASVVIIGGSYIGLEFAGLYKSLGVDVTIIEAEDRLAAGGDKDISDYIARALANRGMRVETGVRVTRVSEDQGLVTVWAQKEGREETFSAQALFVATGRSPKLEGLGLESANIGRGRKGIEVDGYLRTSEPSVYAIGDVTPSPQLEHVAVYEGWLAVNNMFSGAQMEADYRFMPKVMFSDPEVATLGLTEAEARQAGEVVSVTLPYEALAVAQITQEKEGLIKLIADKRDGVLVGVHIVGADAGNLVHLALLAIQAGLPVDHMDEAVPAYPTLAQGFYYACRLLAEQLPRREAA